MARFIYGVPLRRCTFQSTAILQNLLIILCHRLLWTGHQTRKLSFVSQPNILLTWTRPLNTVGMPYYKENLLSSWPSHIVFEVGAPPPKIDNSILGNMTRTEMGFFAKNPRTKRRNQAESRRQSDRITDSLSAPKFLSEQSRVAQPYNSDSDSKAAETMESLTDLHLEDITRKEVPSMYGNVEIKYSKFGVDDFDFAYVWPLHKPSLSESKQIAVTTTKRHTPDWKHISQTRMLIRYCNCFALLP